MTKNYRLKKSKAYNYWSIQFKHARRIWSQSDPEKSKCVELSRQKVGSRFLYKCSLCCELFDYKLVQCDHIEPIANSVPISKDEFLTSFLKLHVDFESLQMLCLTCHKAKTKKEIQEKCAKKNLK